MGLLVGLSELMYEKPLEERVALSKMLNKCERLLIHRHCLPAADRSPLPCLSESPNQFNLTDLYGGSSWEPPGARH